MEKFCVALLLAVLAVGAGEFAVDETLSETPPVERIGPPTYRGPDVGRPHQWSRLRLDRGGSPVERTPVSRETYYQWLVDSGHLEYVDQADRRGQYGPRHLMPVLAHYVRTGDEHYGRACITMLKHFHAYLKAEVEKTGWHSMFITEPVYIGLYRRYLTAGGLLDPEAEWFREMVLYMNRHVHVWATPATFWRGPMHRAQDEGIMKDLASRWYPDAPEAAAWRDYAATVYQDWWRYRDNPPNDTGYYFAIMYPLILHAELTDNQEFFSDAEMQRVWERLILEVSPDGIPLPYGAHGGILSNAGSRLAMLEILAARTGDGRYRFVAHRLMNRLQHHQERIFQHHILAGPETTEPIAVAYLLADDTVQPVTPTPGSAITWRKETLRLRTKDAAERWLGNLDPRPDRARICCSLIVTDRLLPSKLVLRSSWEPGSLFALVDLFPRHDPLNTSGVLGLTRHGAVMTTTFSAKGESDENRLMIEDLSGTAPLRGNTDRDLADLYYQEIDEPWLADRRRASFARVTIRNYMGFPATLERTFVFVKDRFLVIRDDVRFEASFLARVYPVFNTQCIGPQVGDHWANTYFAEMQAAEHSLINPPVDLLVYFLPQPDRQFQVVDRLAAEPRASSAPGQLRYVWRGVVTPETHLHFTQVLYPHAPTLGGRLSNAAGARREQQVPEAVGADAIETIEDSDTRTVIRCTFPDGQTEWVIVNPDGQAVATDELRTDARYAYLQLHADKLLRGSTVEATEVTVAGEAWHRSDEREEADK